MGVGGEIYFFKKGSLSLSKELYIKNRSKIYYVTHNSIAQIHATKSPAWSDPSRQQNQGSHFRHVQRKGQFPTGVGWGGIGGGGERESCHEL